MKTEHLSQKTASYVFSFENENPPPRKVEPALKPKTKVVNSKNGPRRVKNHESNKKNGSFSKSTTTHHTPDHIIAERIRREKISQLFIALSSHIPNLKKVHFSIYTHLTQTSKYLYTWYYIFAGILI